LEAFEIPPPMIKKQHGFTLLELVIAMALAAMVVALLGSGLNILVRDWQRSTAALDEKLDNSLVLLQIERSFQGAFTHLYMHSKEKRRYIWFEGKKDRVTWVSTASPQRQPGLYAWQIEPGKDKKGIRLRVAPAFADDPSKRLKKAKPMLLFENYQARFEFLDHDPRYKDSDFEKGKWLKEWSAKKRQSLPHAVRMTLRKSDNKEDTLEIIGLILAPQHFTLNPKRVN